VVLLLSTFCCLSVALVAVKINCNPTKSARVVQDWYQRHHHHQLAIRYSPSVLAIVRLLPRHLQIRHGNTCCIRVCPCSEGSLFSIPSTKIDIFLHWTCYLINTSAG
jgi:hypothetical protein